MVFVPIFFCIFAIYIYIYNVYRTDTLYKCRHKQDFQPMSKDKETHHLLPHYYTDLIEAGCDEAGRGCLAGSVYAAAVILPRNYDNPLLNDSKKLSEKKRRELRDMIVRDAVAWAVGVVTPEEIDKINILKASFLAMHRALDQLKVRPEAVIVDGNRFTPYQDLPYTTIVKGDGK